MRHQKCRWTQSHSKFYFTSASGKVALATEKKLSYFTWSHSCPYYIQILVRDNGCNLSYCKSIGNSSSESGTVRLLMGREATQSLLSHESGLQVVLGRASGGMAPALLLLPLPSDKPEQMQL